MTDIIPLFSEKLSEINMQFIKEIEPDRKNLFDYCKSISSSIWEAEELVHETIQKAFVQTTITQGYNDDTNSYLCKIASESCIKKYSVSHSKEIVDSYATTFNTSDKNKMVTLLSSDVTYEVMGIVKEIGIETIQSGSWSHAAQVPMRSEVINYQGEWIIIRFITDKEGIEKMSGVLRIREENSKIVYIKDYFFSPEILTIIGEEFKYKYRTNGHHWAV